MTFHLTRKTPRRSGVAIFVAVAFLLGTGLSTREAFAYTDLIPNLTSYYTLDNTSSDSLGVNPGSTGNVSWSSNPGKINFGFLSTTTGDYISIGPSLTVAPTVFTWNIWVYPTSFSNNPNILSAGTGGQPGIRVDTSGYVHFQNVAFGPLSTSAVPLPLNVWTMVTLSYDDTTGDYSMYFNGTLDDSGVVSGAPNLFSGNGCGSGGGCVLNIGNSAGEHWNGTLDEFGIWNSVLSSSQISELYSSGFGTQYPFSGPAGDNSTHIISVQPATSTATGTQSFGFTAYVNPSDWSSSDYWTLSMSPLDSLKLLPGQGIFTDPYIQLASGTVSFSTTTDFVATGNYAMTIHYFHATCGLFGFSPGFCFTQLLATTTDFVVSTTSPFRQLEAGIQTDIDSALASTTLAFAPVCSPFSTSFDPAICIGLVVVPSSDSINADLSMLEQQAPWGYAFRFYDILTGSSTAMLPIISATVPSSLPGAGASITLNINHSLDFFFNATSSVFNNASASSTQTWGQIITQYFTYLVQIGFVIYLITRLFSISDATEAVDFNQEKL